MPYIVGLLRSHVKHVSSMNEDGTYNRQDFEQDDSYNERLVVFINDDQNTVELVTDTLNLPMPNFKDILERLIIPFTILNSTPKYIFNPSDK